jgi:hypothetical protein
MIKMFKRLLSLFRVFTYKDNRTELNVNNKNGSVLFSHNDDNTMNIEFYLPFILKDDNSDMYNEEDIVKKSELYAQMLVLINSGAYKQTIINGLKYIVNNNDDVNHKLLASNVLSFYLILDKAHSHNIAASEASIEGPTIKPTEVFKMQ